ncbi:MULTISPECIES: YggT family protein [Actinomyces]|uniref:YggT family protein n=2 Tax=Actinomyces TaxID=1654 RepID=A0A853EK64_9ACTO|nr:MULTISPECIES: YggT family protein [Actinomyces]MBF0696268.1 YggT family protein [Actinomyces bowdenii]MCR2052618.1 YggT family protein [Actinomyces bowdenii]MDO5064217.1 YggT family protein [Actinomyces bowdenii]NYS68441.1 YggT family protein [Actinomyces bowdenii]BDA63270.1 hemolysin [Actinomyces capricornis]
MIIPALLARILSSVLSLYVLVLLIRVVLDWVQLFARQWRPTGAVLVVANLIYALTDPPLRWIRRVLPMVRMGGLGIDLSFLVLILGIMIVQRLLALLF